MFQEQNQSPEFKEQKKINDKPKLNRVKPLILLGGAMALYPNISEGNEKLNLNQSNLEIQSDTNNYEKINPNPEDYDLEKIGKLDLRYLKEKKNCDEKTAKRIISAAVIYDLTEDSTKTMIHNLTERLYEYDAQHPEMATLDIEEKLKNQEFNDLYQHYNNAVKKFDELYPTIMEETEEKTNTRLNQANVSERMRKYINEAPRLIETVELIRTKILEQINSDEYLKMLQIEFECSPEVAKVHQNVRFHNVELINYIFTEVKNIKSSNNKAAAGIFYRNTNSILLPYNIDFDDRGDESEVYITFFKVVVKHEFWHAATNAKAGLSKNAKKLLTVTEAQLTGSDSLYNIEYYGNPEEQYVRFKSLEDELNAAGIWSKGKIFSRDCSDKMLDAYKNNAYKNSDSYQFIKTIIKSSDKSGYGSLMDYNDLFKIFSNIFNSIAEVNQDKNKTYYHPEWNYNNTEDKT